ncbi:Oxo-4-hydroxy-4-carboxy-5-ureidoimidazoline decarboxylase [Protomyces lactucae-debilis]|uniref:Oxo-4-hydroxy-4-carboxy-5-ureidoimidazoline decarboxylase n=1 Tax=Protomyces lactucae-debilis TaxID=2754530 RepID=A0A1Y2FAI3_PROLT|nr:Oxo-4-hydroxy-4-carboxy-5-ureidoimidazoline decarboxylase [Protomyces lactucae-debilis]ORY79875.1 Oxo-4-hydroxy-4-carboxy-5-ureidoimidazoline decarboxylase [Protomyces lactucae-debilis]
MDAADSQLNLALSQIDKLFEPSPALRILLSANEEALLQESDNGKATPDLIAYIAKQLRAIKGRKELDEILNAHPRLGAKKVDSDSSKAEQASLQGSSEEAERLGKLNDKYEAAFPGLRYVVFVNGRSRDVIMADMERRIKAGNREAEVETSIQAMQDIAMDRLRSL